MIAISKRISYKSKSAVFRLYCLGDIHAGVVHCAEDKIRKKVKEIAADPFALWVGMGDYMEAIAPNDPRFDIGIIADWVEKTNVAESERKWVRDLFMPIKDKCLGLLTGNHEETVRLKNNQDVYLDLCRDLDVPRLGYSCFIWLLFERMRENIKWDTQGFVCHFEHGSGAAQTEGGKMMRLKKTLDYFDADIYGMGHLHDIKTLTSPRLGIDKALHIKQQVRVGAITGSWFRGYFESETPSYVEKHGYSPAVIGCPVFEIQPYHRKILVY